MKVRKHNRDDVVVLMAPLHGVSATQHELLRARSLKNRAGRKADIIMHSEGDRPKRRGAFKNMHLWKHFTGPLVPKDARGRVPSWDCVILVKKHFKTIVKWSMKAADAAEPLKIAPDRYIVEWEGFVRWIRLRAITEHPHAAIHPPMSSKREQEYIKQAEIWRNRISHSLAMDVPTIAGGDLNYGLGTSERWMPERIYNDLQMGYHKEDVTWIGWSKKHFECIDVIVIPPNVNGQDHNWIMITLRRRGA